MRSRVLVPLLFRCRRREPVTTTDDLFYAFEAAGVGATVTLEVVRDGAAREVRVTLVALE
ncbi:MAG: hypothetical protein AB2A00_25600 [Myxococcota bacterium]